MLDQPYFADLEDLSQTIRDMLATSLPPLNERDSAESRTSSAAALWKHLEQIGVPGIGIEEAYGGMGGELRDLAVVARELGRALAPESLVVPALVAELLSPSAADPVLGRVVRELASGQHVAVALPAAGSDAASVHIQGARVSGRLTGVVDLDKARWLLISTADRLVVIDVHDEGLWIEKVDHTAVMRTLASVTLEDVPVSVHGVGARQRGKAIATARVLLAYEMLGAAEAALESASEYASVREQFGAPIGSFQAVAHRLAAAYIQLQAAVASAAYALRAHGETPYEVAALIARAEALRCLTGACEAGMQVFGAVAFTWEHHLHHYLKYAKSCDRLLATGAMVEAEIVGHLESGE